MGSCLSGESGAASATAPYVLASLGSTDVKRGSSFRKNQIKSHDSMSEIELHRVPGRFILNGFTDVASLYIKQGKKGVNQDAMIVWENFGSKEDTIFCGVFDGHGPNGHLVAKKVRDSLPLKLKSQWELGNSRELGDMSGTTVESLTDGTPLNYVGSIDGALTTNLNHEHKENQGDMFLTLQESYLKAFKVMDKELKLHPYIDCFYSGTTAVTLIKQGQDLVIGNVGDSRAVLGTRDEDDSIVAIQLTEDLKPDLPRESERIRHRRGRVFAHPREPDIPRVWLPNSDSPGLAMSRAFGDFCLKDFGLISVPEVSHHRITEEDEFVVLATDGIWDVLSNEDVVRMVDSAPRQNAARTLVDSAIRTWRSRFPMAKIDDCAVVCLFLNSTSDNCCTSYSMSSEQVSLINNEHTLEQTKGPENFSTIQGPESQ